jgi:hypothetical protein
MTSLSRNVVRQHTQLVAIFEVDLVVAPIWIIARLEDEAALEETAHLAEASLVVVGAVLAARMALQLVVVLRRFKVLYGRLPVTVLPDSPSSEEGFTLCGIYASQPNEFLGINVNVFRCRLYPF